MGGLRWRALLASSLLVALGLLALPAPQAEAANGRWCPAQTGYCAENAFYDFWQAVDSATGGRALEVLGYPIDVTRRAPNGLIIQFYERAVMEWHPENQGVYQVLLTRLGATMIDGSPRLNDPPVSCATGEQCYLFSATNHTLHGAFYDYWTAGGGLPVFGMALTEQFQEQNSADGRSYTVQYFERNRFEYHPETADPRYRVLLGRLGAELFAPNAAVVRSWSVVATPNYGDTTPVASPAAAQFKAQAIQLIEQTYPGLRDVVSVCEAGRLPCHSTFNVAVYTYSQQYSATFALGGTVPGQCITLWQQIMAGWGQGKAALSPLSDGTYPFSDGAALNAAITAGNWLTATENLIVNQPGTCQ